MLIGENDKHIPAAQTLLERLEKVLPVKDLIMGDRYDKETWKITYVKTPDRDQQKQLSDIIDSFDPRERKVPSSCTPYQARVVLDQVGLLDKVEEMVAQGPKPLQYAWYYGISVERDSPMIKQLGSALGLSSSQIDDLFIQAQQVQ